jgi:hypothetical protein
MVSRQAFAGVLRGVGGVKRRHERPPAALQVQVGRDDQDRYCMTISPRTNSYG